MMRNLPKTWDTCLLNKCAKIFFSNVDKKTSKNELPVYLCNYMDVYKNERITSEISFMEATAKQIEIDKFRLRKGDVIITKDSETPDDIAIPAFVSEDFENVICGYHLALIRPEADILLGEFLAKLIQLKFYKHYFLTLANGVTRYGLTAQAVKKAKIILPTLPEQKKISQIILLWDSAIESIRRLLVLKKKRRKGLVQQLLIGKRRFIEFVSSGEIIDHKFFKLPKEWEYVPLKSVARVISNKNINDDKIPVLSCTKYDGLVDSLRYFNKKNYSDNLKTYKIVSRGMFAYATNHIEEGSIGHQNVYDRALISPMYTVFEVNNKRINEKYLFYLLKTETYRHIFEINTNASVERRGSLRWGDFSKIHIPLPSIDEQNKIVAAVDALSSEISKYEEKMELMKDQKKGLMQQLLTGKKRVKVQE